MGTRCSLWQRFSMRRATKTRRSRTFAERFVYTNRRATSSQPKEQRRCCSKEQFQNEEEPQPGLLLSCAIHYRQPVLPLPQASCIAWPEPLRTMLVDGTAASETIASAEAINFFVFDI